MDAPLFDFDAPLAQQPPFRGRRRASRHASWTGAHCAVKTWTAKQSAYLQLLKQGGPLTDQAAAALLQWPLSSVNSIRNGLEDQARAKGKPSPFVDCGFDTQTWDGGRTTQRTRWGLR